MDTLSIVRHLVVSSERRHKEAMTLYEIKREYLDILDNLEVNEDGEVLNLEKIDEIKADFEEKAENVALFIKNLKLFSNGITEEKKALDKRKNSIEKHIARLNKYLVDNLRELDKKNLETTKVKVSYSISTAVDIDDKLEPFDLPDKYLTKKVTEQPNRKAIREALESGEIVQGCKIVTNYNVQIK